MFILVPDRSKDLFSIRGPCRCEDSVVAAQKTTASGPIRPDQPQLGCFQRRGRVCHVGDQFSVRRDDCTFKSPVGWRLTGEMAFFPSDEVMQPNIVPSERNEAPVS